MGAYRFALSPDTQDSKRRVKRVLAVASGGGHWVQLLRLAPAFCHHDVRYVTVSPDYASDVPGAKLYSVIDATAWNKVKLVWQAFQILMIVLWERPDVVISTGAAPGYFAVRFGKMLRARTVWLDSIANVERLSRSGREVRQYADVWLTQWPHLAKEDGPVFSGAVL